MFIPEATMSKCQVSWADSCWEKSSCQCRAVISGLPNLIARTRKAKCSRKYVSRCKHTAAVATDQEKVDSCQRINQSHAEQQVRGSI